MVLFENVIGPALKKNEKVIDVFLDESSSAIAGGLKKFAKFVIECIHESFIAAQSPSTVSEGHQRSTVSTENNEQKSTVSFQQQLFNLFGDENIPVSIDLHDEGKD